MRQHRLIHDQPLPGPLNMAIDEAILNAVSRGEVPPTLRFYAWSPPCLSLGIGQRTADVDRDRLAAQGWHLVRRTTGGKAILHIDELTYSLTLPAEHPLAQLDIVTSYRRISEALLAGLNGLNLTTQADRRAPDAPRPGAVCFEVPSHYEITTLSGRKLIGSAQRRRHGALLQHGSLPLHGDMGRIVDVLHYPNAIEREEARFAVRKRATTLSDALDGHPVAWQDAVQALTNGFAAVLDGTFTPGELTITERQEAAHLHDTVYTHEDWTARH